jgi:hypothetical protein
MDTAMTELQTVTVYVLAIPAAVAVLIAAGLVGLRRTRRRLRAERAQLRAAGVWAPEDTQPI